MYHPPNDTAGRTWTPAPNNGVGPITTGGMMGVYLSADEDVDWHTSYNPDGSQNINGYTIKKKGLVPIPERCLDPQQYLINIDPTDIL